MNRVQAGGRLSHEDYRHRHIDIDIEERRERRFYIPQHFQTKMLLLEDILKREGISLSAWFRRQAEEYVRLHEPGNPQQRIDTIMRLGRPYRANPLCRCGVLASRRVVTESNEVVFCCSLHMPKNFKSYKELKRRG